MKSWIVVLMSCWLFFGWQTAWAWSAKKAPPTDEVEASSDAHSSSKEATPPSEIVLVNGVVFQGWVLSRTEAELTVLLTRGSEVLKLPNTLVQSIGERSEMAPAIPPFPEPADASVATPEVQTLPSSDEVYRLWQQGSRKAADEAGRRYPPDPGAATAISLLPGGLGVQGVGQLYNGQVGKGFAFFLGGVSSAALAFYGWKNDNRRLLILGSGADLVFLIAGAADAHNTAWRYRLAPTAVSRSVRPELGAATTSSGAVVPTIGLALRW